MFLTFTKSFNDELTNLITIGVEKKTFDLLSACQIKRNGIFLSHEKLRITIP